jgi:hypothetical protein
MEALCPSNWSCLKECVQSPKGWYAAEFVSPAIEKELIFAIRTLPLQPFQFGVFEGKRRVASFGFRYDYDLRQLQRAEPIPLAGGNRCKRRDIRRSCNPDSAGSPYRIRRGGWHRLAPRQTAFRRDIRPIAWIRLQVSQTGRQDMGSLHDRCRTPVALHDDRRIATDMGTQHSRRRGAQIFNYVSHDDQWT